MLNVATICSGSDAPLFALPDSELGCEPLGHGRRSKVNHLFSCEIEPFKQAFIRLNVNENVVIFRDVVELASGAKA